MFSYSLNVDELRSFLKTIEYNYTVQIQNKLGDKLYYFNDISTGKINKNEYLYQLTATQNLLKLISNQF